MSIRSAVEVFIKIATYNVNGINARLPVLLRWLTEAQPDVVCLQELKAPQEKFPQKIIEDSGYEAIWHGQKSWNGVAILFWDYFRNSYARDAGLRIDHLLLSPKLSKRLIACGVAGNVRSWEKSSDHAPVWITLN